MIDLYTADRKVRATFLSCKTPAQINSAKKLRQLYMDEVRRQNEKAIQDIYGPDDAVFVKKFCGSFWILVVFAFLAGVGAVVLFIVLGFARIIGIKQL